MLALSAALTEINNSTQAFVEMRKGLIKLEELGELNYAQKQILYHLLEFTVAVESSQDKRKEFVLKNSLNLDISTCKN